MIVQYELTLPSMGRGIHLVSPFFERELKTLPEKGICHLLILHTSAGLCLNENADPDVRKDFASFMDRLVPENPAIYSHVLEGADDMPAHLKSSLLGHSLVLPVQNGRLRLGSWQGIYLCEFRDAAGPRKVMVTLLGE